MATPPPPPPPPPIQSPPPPPPLREHSHEHFHPLTLLSTETRSRGASSWRGNGRMRTPRSLNSSANSPRRRARCVCVCAFEENSRHAWPERNACILLYYSGRRRDCCHAAWIDQLRHFPTFFMPEREGKTHEISRFFRPKHVRRDSCHARAGELLHFLLPHRGGEKERNH